MKKPKIPIAPFFKPCSPIAPQDQIQDKTVLTTVSISQYSPYTLGEFVHLVKDKYTNCDPKNLLIEFSIVEKYGDTNIELQVCNNGTINNPNFKQELKKYKKELAKYKEDLKKYEREMEIYQREMDKYNLAQSREQVKRLEEKLKVNS